MPSFFPCPNRACGYQFDADQLPAAAMVTCPLCRTRFPYRAAAPTRAAESQDFSSPSAAPEPAARERPNRLVTSHYNAKSSKSQSVMMIAGFTLVAITVIAVIMISSRKSWFKKEEQGETYTDGNFNFNFKRFETSWREDTGLRGDTFNGFLQKSADQEAWIGLRCVYLGGGNGIRGPADGELESQLNLVLRKFTAVQKETTTADISTKKGVPGYKFTGNLGDTAVWGEIFAFDHKGIGYVLAVWSSADKWETARGDLVKLRDSFQFASARDNWKDNKPGGSRIISDGGDFQVSDTTKGLWEKAIPEPKPDEKSPPPKRGTYVRNATDEDENAVMLLQCMRPEDYDKARREYPAEVMVLSLAKVPDNVDAVKQYVHDALVRKEGDRKVDFTFEMLDKQPFDSPAMPADVKAYRVTNTFDRSQKKYYAIKVLKIGANTVAAVGWCREADSDLMGPYIVNMVRTLQPR
jgi:hypothetical protein